MMNGLNLHGIVRGCIPPLHPDEKVLLIQNVGKANVRGVVTATFADAVQVIAQIQSMSTDDLRAMNDVSRTEIQRKCWLFHRGVTTWGPRDFLRIPSVPVCPDILRERIIIGQDPAALVRQLERGGDMIRRADGSWWLVAGLMEDFRNSGWVSVRIVEQITPPAGAAEKAAAWEASHDS